MGLLRNFEEEKKEVQEVKTSIQDESVELMRILKIKESELKLELEHTKKLNKLVQDELKKLDVVLEKIVNQIESNDEKFTRETEELKEQNKLFIEALENSEFLRKLDFKVQKNIAEICNAKNVKSLEIEEKIDNEIIKFRNSCTIREIISWILLAILSIIWAFSHFTYKGKIKEYQEISKIQYNKIINILSENDKFWYSSKDKKAYLENIKNIEKAKEQEQKEQKK